MSSYAAQKGRAAPVARSPQTVEARTLTEAEEARVANNRDLVLEHMPEMLQIIRQLHAEGLIDGWRSVRCTLLDDAGNE